IIDDSLISEDIRQNVDEDQKDGGSKRDKALELKESREIFIQLTTPLDSKDNKEMAARFLKGGYEQDGYGVEEGAANDGSYSLKGNQGYFTKEGRETFLKIVADMKEFFKRREEKLGKKIKYIIKPGIGGQHTPFQGIASGFEIIDVVSGKIIGEYELGKNYEKVIVEALKEYNIGWDEVGVIPSSKSGSTDETMMVFVDVLYVLMKYIAKNEGIEGEKFANIVLKTLHQVNFIEGKERKGADLFKGFSLQLIVDNANKSGLEVNYEQVKEVFGIVLGNMFFETTDRPSASRLSAFIRNSGLDKELGEDAPGFGGMYDNVGGRWTGDLHMMAFLAYHNLDAEEYWNIRYKGINKVRNGEHVANELGNKITDEEIKNIALV
ncbi:MAG: hypothetical protein KAJ14_10415, partial [Candidatus Omnitrophica bacterium]|nr:hypothetical protein [Candidatus Omnitrophota bacterium]